MRLLAACGAVTENGSLLLPAAASSFPAAELSFESPINAGESHKK